MSDPPRTPSQRLQDDIAIWKLRDENERLRKEREGGVSHGGRNGDAPWVAKAVFQIVMGLFLLMLTAIAGIMWSRLDRFDVIQQARGERVRALELQVEELQRGRSENRAAIEYLQRQLYGSPVPTLPNDRRR